LHNVGDISCNSALPRAFLSFQALQPIHLHLTIKRFFSRRWKVFTAVDPAADIAEEDIFCLEAMKQAEPWEFEVVAASWKDVDITGIVIDAVDAAQA
jgi:hypothetical protein